MEATVAEDKIHGSLATLTIKSAPQVPKDKINEEVTKILGCYTVKYRLDILMVPNF